MSVRKERLVMLAAGGGGVAAFLVGLLTGVARGQSIIDDLVMALTMGLGVFSGTGIYLSWVLSVLREGREKTSETNEAGVPEIRLLDRDDPWEDIKGRFSVEQLVSAIRKMLTDRKSDRG